MVRLGTILLAAFMLTSCATVTTTKRQLVGCEEHVKFVRRVNKNTPAGVDRCVIHKVNNKGDGDIICGCIVIDLP